MDIIYWIVMAVLILIILVPIIIRLAWRSKYADQFRKVEVGMTYDEVIKFLGEDPDFETNAENIKTCTWEWYHGGGGRRVIIGSKDTYIITFKDNIVISIQEIV
ncbi:MAG: hypothetical protein FWE03_03890 [Firmicutes bacterium]|nr:hypothetical protein [Bacillota bacterium]